MNNNEPAFPTLEQNGNSSWNTYEGLTKREWFAGMALMGYVSKNGLSFNDQSVAIGCYTVADAMIVESKKKPTP